MPIATQTWDGATPPAIPSGWNAPGQYTTDASGSSPTPLSSPNVLKCATSAANTTYVATYQAQDGNSGNVTESASFLVESGSSVMRCFVVARGSASPIVAGSSSFYKCGIEFDANTVILQVVNSGTQSAVATETGFSWTTGVWYTVAFSLNGSSLSATVQRSSDSFYWSNGTGWQSGVVTAVSGTDGSVSGQGYSGIAMASNGVTDTAYSDNWELDVYGGTISIYAGDGGSSAEAAAASSVVPTNLYGADAASATQIAILGILGGENGIATDGASFITLPGGDSGISGESGYYSATMTFLDAASTSDVSWLTVSLYPGDSGTSIESSLMTIGDGDFPTAFDLALATSVIPTVISTDDAPSFEEIGIPVVLGADFGVAADRSWQTVTILVGDSGTESDAVAFLTLLGASDDAAFAVECSSTLTFQAGYLVYSNTGTGDPINYAAPIATIVGFENTTWTSSVLAYPGTWKFGVRAMDANGVEQNLDCAVTIILDASGNDITNIPNPPSGLRAFATANGGIRVEWWYPNTIGAKTPTGFHVYSGTGGTPNYASAVATVAYNSGIFNAFFSDLSGLVGGTSYSIGVRAYNSSGTEQNTTTVTVTADTTGPSAVTSLTASAIV